MIKNRVLPSGLRIIAEELPYLRSVSIGIWILTGSSYEDRTNSGISHFLEHMLFKGTSKRTAKQIVEEFDRIGGQLEAFTSREFTCFAARVLDTHLPLAIDILHDIVINSTIPEKEIKKEKGVVFEEINMYEDTPQELVHDLLANELWGGHPIGMSILGTSDNVNNFSRDSIIDYYKKYYSSDNIVITAAGNLKTDIFFDEIQKYFGSLDKVKKDSARTAPEPHKSINIINKKLEQVHFCLGTAGLPFKHPKRYSLYLLNSLLGGSMSSRLFQNVREKHGLVYSIYSYQSSYSSSGIFSIYAGTKKSNFFKVFDIILNELNKIKLNLITEQELYNTKEQLKGGITLNLESTESRMGHLAKSEIYFQKHITIDDIFKKIDSVTREDILKLSQDLFQPDNFTFVAIGPLEDKINIKLEDKIKEKL